jgi:hypothetical protein
LDRAAVWPGKTHHYHCLSNNMILICHFQWRNWWSAPSRHRPCEWRSEQSTPLWWPLNDDFPFLMNDFIQISFFVNLSFALFDLLYVYLVRPASVACFESISIPRSNLS